MTKGRRIGPQGHCEPAEGRRGNLNTYGIFHGGVFIPIYRGLTTDTCGVFCMLARQGFCKQSIYPEFNSPFFQVFNIQFILLNFNYSHYVIPLAVWLAVSDFVPLKLKKNDIFGGHYIKIFFNVIWET